MTFFKNINEREVILRLLFLVAVIVFCVVMMFSIPVILASVLISAVLAYSFSPFVDRMVAKRIPRWISILIIYFVVGGVLFLMYQRSYVGFAGEFENLQNEFPKISERVLTQLKSWEDNHAGTYVFLKDLKAVERVEEYGVQMTRGILKAMPMFLSSLVVLLLLVPFFTFFLLK
ncbi:MAG: AI-2E family transporter, partial [Pseudomonadota bacterium]